MQFVDLANGNLLLLYRKDWRDVGPLVGIHSAGRQVKLNVLNRLPYLPATDFGWETLSLAGID
jgi:hypothetical protein